MRPALLLFLTACGVAESAPELRPRPAATPTGLPAPRGATLPSPTEANTSKLRPTTDVLTFNIRWDDPSAPDDEAWSIRRRGAIAILDAASPDLIGTQEAMRSQVDDLTRALPAYVAISTATKRDPEQHDSLLFVRRDRYTIVETHHFWLSRTPDVPYSDDFEREGGRGNGPRTVSCALLLDRDDDDRRVAFCNTHWDGDVLVNERSALLVRKRLTTRFPGASLVLTGDFNTLPLASDEWDEAPEWASHLRSNAYGVLLSFLVDTHRAVFPEAGPALLCPPGDGCPPEGFGVRVDGILASPDWAVEDVLTLRRFADGVAVSDHWPVLARLRAPKRKPSI